MTQYSLYNNTSVTTYSRGYYKSIDIPMDDTTDYYIEVGKEYENKPGKLANDLYGTPRLEWIFYYFNKNKMDDMIFSLKAGMRIKVPTKSRLLKYF